MPPSIDISKSAASDIRRKYFTTENTFIALPGLQAGALMVGIVHYIDTADLFRSIPGTPQDDTVLQTISLKNATGQKGSNLL